MSQISPAPSTPWLQRSSEERQRTRPFRWWHDAIIDDMLAYPTDPVRKRAARLGHSESYLSRIMGSDMFKAAFAARRQQYTELLNSALVHKTALVAEKGLNILVEQLETKRTSLPFAVVAETTLSVLEKLGFGPQPKAGGVTVNVQQNNANSALAPVSAELLDSARQRLRQAEQVHMIEQSPAEGGALAPGSSMPQVEDSRKPGEG